MCAYAPLDGHKLVKYSREACRRRGRALGTWAWALGQTAAPWKLAVLLALVCIIVTRNGRLDLDHTELTGFWNVT